MKAMNLIVTVMMSSAIITAIGCKEESKTTLTPVQQGQKIYKSYCISCHNLNPRIDGGLGPSVWGSSRELLEARVLRGVYPEGYRPKRESKLMTTFPYLAKEVDALHAFLNSQP